MTENGDKNYYHLFVPKTILGPRRHIELRILFFFFFHSMNRNCMLRTKIFCNETKIKNRVLNTNKREKKYIYTHTLIKLNFFLWPNYRLQVYNTPIFIQRVTYEKY